MNTGKSTVEYEESMVMADSFIRDYYKPRESLKACQACSNYGHLWSCPPFDRPPVDRLRHYRKVTLLGARITPGLDDEPLETAADYLLPVRVELERRLLERERLTGGRALTFVGRCLHCPEGECTRGGGGECRHPDMVRPSLEACGFDVVAAASGVLGMRILWGENGRLPSYLTLVGALFHD